MSLEPLRLEGLLSRRAAVGDEAAFRELAAAFRGELQAHCYRIVGSVQDAEDLVQETLLAAWRGLDGFEGRASLRSWLTNRCLNVLRDRGRRIPPEPQPPFHADGHHPIDRGPAVTDPDIGSWFITFPLRNRHEKQARHPIRSQPDLELGRVHRILARTASSGAG